MERLYPKGRFERDESGYWVDIEPMEEKRVRAVEKLREELAEFRSRYERPRGLYAKATKGFTGDEYAFVYRTGQALRTGKAPKPKPDQDAAVRGAGGFTEAQIRDAEQAEFTETQISDAIGRLYPKGRFEKDESGYWVDVEPMEEKRARAVMMLKEALAEVKPRYERPSGLYATKGFTGDEYAFVYRSGQAFRGKSPERKPDQDAAVKVAGGLSFTETQISA